ncbi:hypothetical protein A2U01_0068158, partial [Trifolium medium]|nr:hypothetical protein [Trifolium medium]
VQKQGEIEQEELEKFFLLIIWYSGTCAPRRGTGALRRSVSKSRSLFWKVRVAQADVARRAEENFKSECI